MIYIVCRDCCSYLSSIVLTDVIIYLQGYFRKAVALTALHHYEDAAYSYLQCLSLDPSLYSARSALTEVSSIIIFTL